jgi:anti-sigma B factor antagonist
VRCAGEIDQSSAPDLTRTLGEVMGSEAAKLVLDLTEVGFIDSTGLHSVIVGATSAEAVGMQFLVVPSRPVARLLELSALRHIVQGRG